MHHLRSRLAIASVLAVLSFRCVAAEVQIVANPGVKADFISAGELRSVFLAETNRLRDGTHVEPVFEREGAVHEAFIKDFLGETNAALVSHYGELVFTGKASMPKSFNSDAEVMAYVARTRGAIGYVSASANRDGVKVLEVTLEEGKTERRLITRVEPEYPDTLLAMHISGTVRLKVVISPQGSVEEAQVLGGNPILAEAAIKAIKQWMYAPAASTTTVQVTIPFDASR